MNLNFELILLFFFFLIKRSDNFIGLILFKTLEYANKRFVTSLRFILNKNLPKTSPSKFLKREYREFIRLDIIKRKY